MSRDTQGGERESEVTMDHEPALDDLLRALGSDPGSTDREASETLHLDAADLAEWLDGVADEAVRERVEEHLASCGECRDLARQVGSAPVLAVAGEAVLADAPDRGAHQRARQKHRRRRQLWAVAATVVFALLSLGILRSAVDPRLGSVGVGPWHRALADRGQLAEAGALLDRGWPEVPALGALPSPGDLGEASAIRGTTPGIELLEPRWEAVPEERPSLRWSMAPGVAVESIVVIDGADRLVARFPLGPSETSTASPEGGEGAWRWPDDAEPLTPGEIYAWKANLRMVGGERGASRYVPFRVLERHESVALERRLSGVLGASPPFLAALELARRGVYSEARRRLETLPPSVVVADLVADLDARQHLAEPPVAEPLVVEESSTHDAEATDDPPRSP